MKMFTTIAVATVALVGVASADDKAPAKDAKAPAKDAKAPVDAKVDPKTAPKPEAPKAPAEVEAMAKAVAGTWKCKGDSFDMAGAKSPVTATNKATLGLDKFWITENLEVKGGMPFKMESFTTFDAKASKWRRVAVNTWGGYMVGTSDGMKDNKMDWTLDTVGPMGTGQFRDHIEGADAKAGTKLWGEMSNDKGKTWVKVYEMVCKK
jgi:hypothetical protein